MFQFTHEKVLNGQEIKRLIFEYQTGHTYDVLADYGYYPLVHLGAIPARFENGVLFPENTEELYEKARKLLNLETK